MTVCTGPVFDMAVKQFELIANYLRIPDDLKTRLLMPKRSVTVLFKAFGNVGSITALELHNMGAKVIGVRDHTGARYRPRGSIYHSWSDMLPRKVAWMATPASLL
ncbi:hypothetical protein ACVWW3_007647 [Bradyrhizobium sp. LM2.9]